MNYSNSIQRRKFLQKMALLAGGSALLTQQGKLQMINNVMAATTASADVQDYKSLVCIFLLGANDGINMFVPMQAGAYSDYQSLRQTVAIRSSDLLPVKPVNGVLSYGFHPAMPATRRLYNQDRIALISNVGNLVEPLNKQQYLDQSIVVPPALFSHSDQINFWQTSAPTRDVSDLELPTGWGGRLADLLAETNSNIDLPHTIAMKTQSLWQQAQETIQLTMNKEDGLGKFTFLSEAASSGLRESRRVEAWKDILAMQRTHALEQQVSGNIMQTRQRITAVKDALALSDGMIDTLPHPQSDLSKQLHMIARMIYAREQLGMKRQIFFVNAPNFDTHKNQLAEHSALLTNLDRGLNSFNQTMEEFANKGVASLDSVTTFTASEFGRTLGSNGDGTDHGWGNHHLVMGGAVTGGTVHGELPIIAAGSPDDIGNAILPKYATDQYGATLAKWMGVSDPDLHTIFPNLGNFPVKNLGFMNS
jgi:uncharacterized protein (DUF1501 family)